MTPTTLGEFLAALKAGEPVPLPDDEEWKGMVERTTAPGRVCQVDEETYWYFLEVLPPRWMGRGAGFAFGEGADHVRLFWRGPDETYFCRQLTADENARFCTLANIPLTTG
jgi:hypothetical protein